MAQYAFETVDVFTTDRFGGNPLAVLPDAAGLDDAAMQRIAREFNLSETTFVFPPGDPANTAQVRIFTPTVELPFAGHPNVGTALVLAGHATTRPDRFVFEEKAGLVAVAFDWTGHGTATIDAPEPLSLGAEIPAAVVARCAGLQPRDVLTGTHAPVIASVGTPFVVAEVTSEALVRAAGNAAAMADAAQTYPVRPIGLPLFLHAADGDGRRTRMFSPLSGIAEDPATGSAAVALAALLLQRGGAAQLEIIMRQGVEMGRPSTLQTRAWQTAEGPRAQVGGSAVPVMQGTLEAA